MLKRFFSLTLVITFCLSALSSAVVYADDDDTPIYEIIDVYVANEKETDYGEIRYTDETRSYSDLSDYDERVVNILTALGFAEAFGSGTEFRPTEPVTRAELVSMAMALINAEDTMQKSERWFTDVLTDYEYYNEISAAAALGIISGYSDGAFYPDKEISFDEAVSLVMKALGYRVAAEVKGGWSMGYRTVANQIGLTKGINPQNDAALSRIEAAYLIYSAMDCPIFRPIVFGETLSYEADKACTPLIEYHDIYKTEDYINATLVSAMPGYSPSDDEHIVIGNKSYIAGKNEYAEFLGYYVEAFYRDNDEVDREIVYLIPSEKLDKLVIKAEDITGFNEFTYMYGDRSRVSINESHTLIVNGKRITEYDKTAFVPANGEVVLLSSGQGYNTVIINTFHTFLLDGITTDRDGYVVFEQQYNLPSFMVDVNNEKQALVVYLDDRRLDFYAEPNDIYNADGSLIHQLVVPDLPYNSVLNIFADKYKTVLGKQVPADDAAFIKIVITTQKVEGKVSSYSNEEISISDTEGGNVQKYKLSDENILSLNKLSYKLGYPGFFLFDYDGRVFAYSTSDGEAQYIMGGDGKKILVDEANLDVGLIYGYLIQTAETGVIDTELMVKILEMDGSITTYPLADRVVLNNESITDAAVIESRLQQSAKLLDPTFEISQLIKYQVNKNGEIIKLETVTQSVGASAGAEKDSLRREHERAEFSSRSEFGWTMWRTSGQYANLPLFNGQARQYFTVPDTETFDERDYTVTSEWWPNNTAKTIDIFDCDETLVPSVVVEYVDPTGDLYHYPYVMVKNIEKGLDENGAAVDVLHFVGLAGDPVLDNAYTLEERRRSPGEEEDTEGGEARFYAETDGLFDGLKRGDLIRIYGKNRRIYKWDMILSLEDAKKFDVSTYPKRVENAREKWDMYEVYTVVEGTDRLLINQRGRITADGKREYMQLNPFEGTMGLILYDASGREPDVSYWNNPYTLDQAMQVGNEDASRVYIWETNVTMKLLVGYIGL